MTTFTITSARAKANTGKVVTILETKEDLVLVKMGRTNLEILLDFKYIDCQDNAKDFDFITDAGVKVKKFRKTLKDVLTSEWGFEMYKVGADKARTGVIINTVKFN